MKTLLELGPHDHGRPLEYEDFASARWTEGFQYEIINGRLYVSPVPNLPQDFLQQWVFGYLYRYSHRRQEVINYITQQGRVFVPDQPDVTQPEPDIAAYRNFPRKRRLARFDWRRVSPILVVEVLSDDADKDLLRNVELYEQVPSIKEYWIIDPRPDPDEPTLIVYRKRAGKWMSPIEVPFGGIYKTRLLPGFRLLVDPHR